MAVRPAPPSNERRVLSAGSCNQRRPVTVLTSSHALRAPVLDLLSENATLRAMTSLMEALLPENQSHISAFYDTLRTENGVFWDEHINALVVTSYEHASAAASQSAFSSVRYLDLDQVPRSLRPLAEVFNAQMLYMDDPDHSRIRDAVKGLFAKSKIEQLRDLVAKRVEQLVERIEPAGQMDLIADLGYPLPVSVIADMIGVDSEDHDALRQWSGDIAVVMSNARPARSEIVSAVQALHELRICLEKVVANASGQASVVLDALTDAVSSGDLSHDELIANLVLFVIAGHETTTNLIGNGMLALLRHPDAMEAVVADRSLVRPAIEEMLRYDSPVQLLLRRAKLDCSVGAHELRAGTTVLVLVGAANMDPAAFENPHAFDIERQANRHLSFGRGAHSCLGVALARLEAEIAFSTLIARFPTLQLATSSVRWHPTISFRGLQELPLTW